MSAQHIGLGIREGSPEFKPELGPERDRKPMRVCLLGCDPSITDALLHTATGIDLNLFSCDTSNLSINTELVFRSDVLIINQERRWDDTLLLAEDIRARTSIGIVLLAEQSRDVLRRSALVRGVDHVLTKPIDPVELAAILRNLGRLCQHSEPKRRRNEANDRWALDHNYWRLIAPTGKGVDLTVSEYKVLNILMTQPGVAFSREELSYALKSRRDGGSGRSLDMLISKLRAKIELGTGKSIPLRAVRSIGYLFVG